jgi:putative ubiquitin-RnfH superfamily antitoxin RatB of RatAB toxin-antitoxin module
MGNADGVVPLRVSVAYSPRPGEVDEVELALEAGATVADALRLSGLQQRHAGLDLGTAPIGLWGARCRLDDVLRDRDRVEVYRALRVDPKEARRQRYRAQVSAKR